MAAYRILTPTLGRVEAIQVAKAAGVATLAPLIAWSWWCRGWPRRWWLAQAYRRAADVLAYELAAEDKRAGPRWDDRRRKDQPPQQYAVEVSVSLGYGLPDEWRAVRYRDVMHAVRYAGWRQEDPKERGPAPVWGGRAAAAPKLRRVV